MHQSLALLSAGIHQHLNLDLILIRSRYIKLEPLQPPQKPNHLSVNGIHMLVLHQPLNRQATRNPSNSSVFVNHTLPNPDMARRTPKAVTSTFPSLDGQIPQVIPQAVQESPTRRRCVRHAIIELGAMPARMLTCLLPALEVEERAVHH